MAFTDDFTGTADTVLDSRSGWTLVIDGTTSDLKINASNQLKWVGAASTAMYLCTDQASANQYAQCNYYGGLVTSCILVLRYSDTTHWVGVDVGATGPKYRLVKCNGTATPSEWLGGSSNSSTTNYSSGDLVRLEVSGNNYTLKVNGATEISVTDTFNNTSTRQGIWMYSGTTSKDPLIDNFEAGVIIGTNQSLMQISG